MLFIYILGFLESSTAIYLKKRNIIPITYDSSDNLNQIINVKEVSRSLFHTLPWDWRKCGVKNNHNIL